MTNPGKGTPQWFGSRGEFEEKVQHNEDGYLWNGEGKRQEGWYRVIAVNLPEARQKLREVTGGEGKGTKKGVQGMMKH